MAAIRVYPDEVVIAASSAELLSFPFLFMTGHKLVRFSQQERARLREFVEHGGPSFPTTATTTSTVSSPSPSKERCGPPSVRPAACPGWPPSILCTAAFSVSRTGRPRLSPRRGARRSVGVLYSNKDYGCEWDYDWRNKRFQREDNTKFAVNIVVHAMS